MLLWFFSSWATREARYYITEVKSLSRVQLFPTPWTAASQAAPGRKNFPGKNTGVGCHFLLHYWRVNRKEKHQISALNKGKAEEHPGSFWISTSQLSICLFQYLSLWYSCRDNPMDRGAWWAMVHGFAKSWTRLSIHWRDFACPSIVLWYLCWKLIDVISVSPFLGPLSCCIDTSQCLCQYHTVLILCSLVCVSHSVKFNSQLPLVLYSPPGFSVHRIL